MDQTSGEFNYPTEWQIVSENDPARIEYRLLSVNTVELRSQTYTITITQKGFDLFKRANETQFHDEYSKAWNRYLKTYNIQSVPRSDSGGS